MTDPRSATEAAPANALAPLATLSAFGHSPVPVRLVLLERSRGWRVRRAVVFAAAGLAVAPLVALLPPHAPWALGALATGGFLAWRSITTRFAVQDLQGACPRCDAAISVAPGSRLREPHPIPCPDCHHELLLSVDTAGLVPG